jgi:hypothetical protein
VQIFIPFGIGDCSDPTRTRPSCASKLSKTNSWARSISPGRFSGGFAKGLPSTADIKARKEAGVSGCLTVSGGSRRLGLFLNKAHLAVRCAAQTGGSSSKWMMFHAIQGITSRTRNSNGTAILGVSNCARQSERTSAIGGLFAQLSSDRDSSLLPEA